MSSDNSTDDRRDARVDAILTAAFPLAGTPDTPIGPIPLFKIRYLLVAAYQAGLASADPVPLVNATRAYIVRDITKPFIDAWRPNTDADGVLHVETEQLRGTLESACAQGYDAGRAVPPEDQGDNETILCQISALFSGIDALANDHESVFDREPARWLVILGRSLVRRLLPEADE